MTIEEALRGIEAEEKLHELRTRGARGFESEASRIGRESLAQLGRKELRERAQPTLRVRRVS